jgi:hypothetical protein
MSRIRRQLTYANVMATISVFRRAVVGSVLASFVLALAGCGSGDSDEAGTGSASGLAPDELVGSYEVTLKPSDLPTNPPVELTDGPPDWRLEIANSGGSGGGRSFAITNEGLGLLEESDFGVEGDSIVLKQEECAREAGGYDFYDNEYRYERRGKSFSFTTVTNSCPDRVAETILTSRAWTRLG